MFRMPEQFEVLGIGDSHECNVDSVGGGAAHHSGNDHAVSCRLMVSRRSCSLNSQSWRDSWLSLAVVGGEVRRFNSLDFFLKASTRREDSATRAANLRSRSASLIKASCARTTNSSW